MDKDVVKVGINFFQSRARFSRENWESSRALLIVSFVPRGGFFFRKAPSIPSGGRALMYRGEGDLLKGAVRFFENRIPRER